jgi:hypothetical protein
VKPTFSNGQYFTSADMTPQEPDPWCKSLPFQPRIFDNTWWQTFIHCPRHFYHSVIQGLRPNIAPGQPQPIHLTFGSLIHDGVDVYTKAVAAGMDTEAATELALAHVLDASWLSGAERDVFGGFYGYVFQCPDRTHTVTKKGIVRCPWSYKEHLAPRYDVEPVTPAPAFTRCECGRDAPLRLTYLCAERVKNRRTAARSIVALCDHLTAGNVRPRVLPDGRVGSEYRWFRELGLTSPDGTPYLMTGSFDGVASAPGVATFGSEYKTTQREPNESFWSGLTMSPQVYTYSWALDGEFGAGSRVMLYAIYIGAGFTEILQKIVYMSPGSVAEWQRELEQYVQEAEVRARLAYEAEAAGGDPMSAYPRRLSACNSLPGAPTTPCPFRDFCRLDPADRPSFIAANFHEDRWSPILVKGAIAPESEEA